jgi:hypothetical protein
VTALRKDSRLEVLQAFYLARCARVGRQHAAGCARAFHCTSSVEVKGMALMGGTQTCPPHISLQASLRCGWRRGGTTTRVTPCALSPRALPTCPASVTLPELRAPAMCLLCIASKLCCAAGSRGSDRCSPLVLACVPASLMSR